MAEAKSKNPVTKPDRPDEEQYKSDLAKAQKELDTANEKLKAIKDKLDFAKPNRDSPTAQKQQTLRNELSEIRQQQSAGKNSRSGVLERLKHLDDQIKSRLNEMKTSRSRMGPYKSPDDIDREISRLQKQVDSGTMKLVDEKKALADISSLHKTKKQFGGLDQQQKGIDDLKAQATEIRKQLDDPKSKALSDRYTEVAKELDGLKAEQDAAFKDLNSLRDQRTAAQKEQNAKWEEHKAIKDKYFGARREYQNYEREAQRVRRDRIKAEREANDAAKRKSAAKQRLEDASGPAYGDEITSAEGLIRYFDPSAAPAEKKIDESKFAAEASRKVDEGEFKGMKLAKKDDGEDYMVMGSKSKKGKKGKKGQAAAAGEAATTDSGKFNLSIGVIEQLAALNVDAPSNQGDIPRVVEQLQEKLKFWRENQDEKTKENIAKAQKEIDRLETEAKAANSVNAGGSSTIGAPGGTSTDHARKPAAKNQGVDGPAKTADTIGAENEAAQEEDAVKDAAAEMEKAKIEDAAA